MNRMNKTTTEFLKTPDWTKNFYYGGLKGIYFNRILNKIIKIGNLKSKKVLDFGCGTGNLKKKLGNNVINYDIIPSLSEGIMSPFRSQSKSESTGFWFLFMSKKNLHWSSMFKFSNAVTGILNHLFVLINA